MNYKSTRNPEISITGAQAIAQGLSHEGGLFVPESLPHISEEFIGGFAARAMRTEPLRYSSCF